MPTKIATETQLLRLLGNSPLQVEIDAGAHGDPRIQEHAPWSTCWSTTRPSRRSGTSSFDGLIITGAPVEQLPFEEVDYWEELKEVMDWARTHVYSTFYICWGAQAGLYHYYGVPKHPLPEKMFGVFPHRLNVRYERLARGFDDVFHAPHSRHTEMRREDILAVPDLVLLSESEKPGVYIVISADRRHIFVTGHSEYDPLTLDGEYVRDVAKRPAHRGPPELLPRTTIPPGSPWCAGGATPTCSTPTG